jgi:hypothetical protein
MRVPPNRLRPVPCLKVGGKKDFQQAEAHLSPGRTLTSRRLRTSYFFAVGGNTPFNRRSVAAAP